MNSDEIRQRLALLRDKPKPWAPDVEFLMAVIETIVEAPGWDPTSGVGLEDPEPEDPGILDKLPDWFERLPSAGLRLQAVLDAAPPHLRVAGRAALVQYVGEIEARVRTQRMEYGGTSLEPLPAPADLPYKPGSMKIVLDGEVIYYGRPEHALEFTESRIREAGG
jgi:hypothetical protein